MIADHTAACLDPGHRVRRQALHGIVVHRFGVPGISTATELASWCRRRKALGRRMSYSYVVRPGDRWEIDQALPDDRWGWHCRRRSGWYLAVAVIGDFRKREPDPRQRVALLWLLVRLCHQYELQPTEIFGHDEVPNGTSWPNHKCPGAKLDLPRLRDDVAHWLNWLSD